MIKKEMLIEMFENMRAKTDWKVDGDMLWGYFFTDTDPKRLEVVARRLKDMGYTIVEVRPGEEGDPKRWLHAERAETHSPDTLHERNQEFYALAQECDVASYDGMDAGPAPEKVTVRYRPLAFIGR